MDEKTLKRANSLTSYIESYKKILKELEDPDSTIHIYKYVGSTNLGGGPKVKKPLIRLYKRKLANAERELKSL